MGNKISQKFNRQLKVRQISKYYYDKKQKKLRLGDQEQYWADVLQDKDWSKLNSLELYRCRIDDSSLKVILNNKWPSLNFLDLQHNKITIKGVQMLTKCNWPSLKSISISHNQIGDDGFLLVLELLQTKLELLSVSVCGITMKSLHQAMNYKTHNIKRIFISDNFIGNNGAKYLTKMDMPNLQNLSIYYCGIQEQGIKHLSKGKWHNLKHLYWLACSSDRFRYEKQENKIRLNNWHMLNCYSWKFIENIQFRWAQPIFYLGGMLLHSKNIQLWQSEVQMDNQTFSYAIQDIFYSRFQIRRRLS